MFGYIAAMGYFKLDKEEVTETVAYEDGLELVVTNNDGDVDLEVWNRSDIEVVGTKKTYFGKEHLHNIEMKIEKTDVLKIYVVRERNREWIWMDLKIQIPESMIVQKINGDNGNVDVSGITGDFKIEVNNGDIKAEHVSGNISLSSDNGNVKLEYGTGNFTLDTSNGDIWVDYADRVISAETSNGRVQIYHTDEILSARSSNGLVLVKYSDILHRATINNGKILVIVNDIPVDGMDLRCDNGGVDVTIPNDLKANYSIEVDNGDAKFRGFKDGDTELRVGADSFGLINGGGPKIDIEIDNGDVYLRGE